MKNCKKCVYAALDGCVCYHPAIGRRDTWGYEEWCPLLRRVDGP